MPARNYTPKKKITKTFDTKTILFGSGALVVLLILGLFFTGSLFRRSADNILTAANQSYEKASYEAAIAAYDNYIKRFQNHSGVSTAKVRRALAKIRLAVDGQSDYGIAYNTAAEEIAAVENEPDFYAVSKAELSVLLPKIAAGLADDAQTKTSFLAAERAELTLEVIDKLLPKSLHSAEQIAAVKVKIKIARRTIARQNAMKEAEEKLNELQKTMPFDKTQVEKCYAVVDVLIPEYPELAAQKEFKDLMRKVAENEGQAVITVPISSAEENNRNSSPDSPPAEVHNYNSPSAEKQIEPIHTILVKQTPPTKTETKNRNICSYPFYYKENIYGINLQDGSLAWKQPLRDFVPANVKPKILPYFSSRNIMESGFIIINTENGTFRQYNSRTGELFNAFSLKKKIYISSVVQDEIGCFFAAATENGILTFFCIGSSSVKPSDSYQLPQKIDSPPLFDFQHNSILQFADSQTLFVIPFGQKTEEQQIRSYYTGHSPLTIRIAPAVFNSCCLFVRQTSEKTCELAVFSLEKEVKERELQTFPVEGLVDCPIEVSGSCFAVLSDEGEITLFEKTDNPAAPLKRLGRGSAGNSAETGINRSAVLRGNDIWIAGEQLTQFTLQPAQNRILPIKTLRTEVKTETPLFVNPYNKKQLIHCFTEPDWGGLQIAADDIAADKTADKNTWKTEFAAPVIQEPQLTEKDGKKFLTVYTSNGKSWEIPLDTEEQQTTAPKLELSAGTFGTFNNGIKNVKIPLAKVIPLQDGYSAWIGIAFNSSSVEGLGWSNTIKIFDPTAKENKFNTITLPSPPAAMPIEFDVYLLVPLLNNTIALYDVKTCTFAAEFKPLRHIGKDAKWSNLVVIPNTKSFTVTDNQTEEQDSVLRNNPFVYRIELKNEGGKLSLVEVKQ